MTDVTVNSKRAFLETLKARAERSCLMFDWMLQDGFPLARRSGSARKRGRLNLHGASRRCCRFDFQEDTMNDCISEHVATPAQSVREITTADGAILLDIEARKCIALTPVAFKIWTLTKSHLSCA